MNSLRDIIERSRGFLHDFFNSPLASIWIDAFMDNILSWRIILVFFSWQGFWLELVGIRIYEGWRRLLFNVDDFLVNTVADFYFHKFIERKKKEYELIWRNVTVPAFQSIINSLLAFDQAIFGDPRFDKNFVQDKYFNKRWRKKKKLRIGVSPDSKMLVSDVEQIRILGWVNVVNCYTFVKSFVLPLVISLVLIFILISYFTIDTLTHGGVWIVVGFLFFWLMSGFNFFLKRYRFGKFTSAIQRFWKRTNSYFWLIEGFLFGLFFYYYLNSSQEPLYMFDESNLNQNHLSSLPSVYLSFILLIFMIFYSYYILINLNSFTFKQKLTHLTLVTVGLLFIFLIESYQFYYIITLFYENVWFFDAEHATWDLTFENPRIRVKQQYLILALIAKYWHFLFIFFSWIFLILKVYEQKKIYYPLFGLNLQNFIILFCLNILFTVNWVKWIIRRYYDVTYYWFFIDINNHFLTTFNQELFSFFL